MAISMAEFVSRCYQCGTCSGVCPKARVKPGFLPRRIVHENITGFSSRAVSSGAGWDCLTCGICQKKCPMKVEFLEMFLSMRKEMSNGAGVPCKLAHENFLGSSFYNIMKNEKIKPKRKHLLAKDVKISDTSEVLYFTGCLPYLDIIFKDDVGFEGMEIANNTIRLLNAVGVEPAVLDEEKCCGHDQLWRGDLKTFEELGVQNKNLVKYKTIVTSCPECLRTLAVDYKERLGITLNVKHISEFLVDKAAKLAPNGKKAITFHDSCRLGRYMQTYEQPRELLKSMGYEIKEMARNREDSLCCSISAWVNCDDENKELRRRKLDEAIATDAEILVTPCPKCQIHLKCLQVDKSEPGRKIRIADLSTVLAENLKR
ncbi:MAG: (Fe-S)-binding protein [Euryarchaeota archaeon]|nr:(Fe-S)-binding protein [Euryarchaeota archaeon]